MTLSYVTDCAKKNIHCGDEVYYNALLIQL